MDNKTAESLLPAFAAEATSFGSRERERLRSPILALLSSHGLNQDGYTAPVRLDARKENGGTQTFTHVSSKWNP